MSPRRSDRDTLRLALADATEAWDSPALVARPDRPAIFSVELTLTPTRTTVTIDEPERRQLRDFLVVLRQLDMPSHDANLTRVYEILERVGVRPDWEEPLRIERARYAAGQEPGMFHVQDPDEGPSETPTWIRPREAFELWAYGEVIHADYAKVLRWERMDPVVQSVVRDMAHGYAVMLLRQADFVIGVIRHGLAEPLDDD